ncbi:hypothetical protein ACOMHN_036958 [Nucella lapillus]
MSLLYYGTAEEDPFYLLFSFYEGKPQKVSKQWNCSTSKWPELYLHFPCDLKSQCVDDEDETRCPLYSAECGLGKIAVEGSCFLYFTKKVVPSRWSTRDEELKEFEALRLCEKRGASAARFLSYSQVDSIVEFISRNLQYNDHLMMDLHRTKTLMDYREDIYTQNMYVCCTD